MRIAYCEDEPAQRSRMELLLHTFAERKRLPLTVEAFSDSAAFLFHYPDSYPFDLIFLDIDLGGMDGMALARKIRETDSEVPILFLTNHREYVFEGYEVQAFRYLLKPVTEDTLFPLLDELQTMRGQEKPHLLLSLGGETQKLTSFIMLIPSSVMQSVSAFVAQNTGAGKKDRAWKGFLTAIATGCSLGVVIFCIGFFGGSVISRIFTSDPAVIEQSAAYLRGFAPECILTCVLFSSIGYFNGRGISIPVMIQGITSACLIRIPLALFFSHLPNTNLTFVGMSTPITTVYGICFFMICFARLKKKGQM